MQDSIRCTCINDSIGVMHLLTASLLMMGMLNVGETSPWMSFPRNTTPRNLYDLVFYLCNAVSWCADNTFSNMSVFVMMLFTLGYGLGFALWAC